MELRADERALAIFEEAIPATEQDWETEFLDFILAVKVVDSLDEAIQHINRYNTKHSESIISDNYFATQQFYNKWMQPLFMRMLQLVSRTVLNLDLAPKSALVRKITCPWTYGSSRAYFDKICYLWKWASTFLERKTLDLKIKGFSFSSPMCIFTHEIVHSSTIYS